MKNWNTDVTKFKTKKALRLWELTQLINYGQDGEKLSAKELKANWPMLKDQINPQKRRLLEFYLWNRVYSLPANPNFWEPSPKSLT